MVEVRTFHFPPTALIPNSPRPLLYYPGLLADADAVRAHRLFTSNGWETQWIYRYGPTQTSHYHSAAHECMAVLSGCATIRFGVADTADDLEESTRGEGREDGGIELQVKSGDVFVLPAGLAHKTFDTSPSAPFKLLTPGNGHFIDSGDSATALASIDLSGFTMIGAYPRGSEWDFAKGGENTGHYEKVWSVPIPERDPVLGEATEGLCGLWKRVDISN